MRILRNAPPEEIAWIASHGTLRTLEAGEILSHKSEEVEGLFLLLQGHVALYVDRAGGRHKVIEWKAGDAAGHLPYSRMVVPPGDSIAEEKTEVFLVHRDLFPEMLRECHEITSTLVHVMVDRARHFTSSDLHDEKMVSLGRLAAGLAHELNNPASALARGAKVLPERLDSVEGAARAVGGIAWTADQLRAIDEARGLCLGTLAQQVRSPLQEAERESAISDWLEEHRLDPDLAEPLAETAITIEAFQTLSDAVGEAYLPVTLRWLAAGCSARHLAREIEESSARIFDLVSAVKGFTRMDQAPVDEPVDIGQGLMQTIAVLKAKARSKSLSVSFSVPPTLPPVLGVAGELNQVWLNLLENALDAAPASGHVEIRAEVPAGANPGKVSVRILDDGPGIPPEIAARIFDPFFTTKPVGQGTGLGLDIARRLVRKHDGDITFTSSPGRTEFLVTLPAIREADRSQIPSRGAAAARGEAR